MPCVVPCKTKSRVCRACSALCAACTSYNPRFQMSQMASSCNTVASSIDSHHDVKPKWEMSAPSATPPRPEERYCAHVMMPAAMLRAGGMRASWSAAERYRDTGSAWCGAERSLFASRLHPPGPLLTQVGGDTVTEQRVVSESEEACGPDASHHAAR
eukprot:5717708-Prymnesium_polylepis.3